MGVYGVWECMGVYGSEYVWWEFGSWLAIVYLLAGRIAVLYSCTV